MAYSCQVCELDDTQVDIVHSGTDGFMLGLKAGQLYNICYTCANRQAGLIE
jgi:hypothetical protein